MNQPVAVSGLFEAVRATRGPSGRLILVCRDGRLFGADPEGRVYLGRILTLSHSRPKTVLRGTYQIPRRCRPSRRPDSQSPYLQFPIQAEIDPSAKAQDVTVQIGDRNIEIRITYLGPLPR